MTDKEEKKPKRIVRWTEKFHQVKKIDDEPPLNKEGFWRRYDIPMVKIK